LASSSVSKGIRDIINRVTTKGFELVHLSNGVERVNFTIGYVPQVASAPGLINAFSWTASLSVTPLVAQRPASRWRNPSHASDRPTSFHHAPRLHQRQQALDENSY